MSSDSYVHHITYNAAYINCRCGCFRDINNFLKIDNNLWEYNQRILLASRSKLNTEEIDTILKQALANELKKHPIESTSQHIKLKFDLVFEIPSATNNSSCASSVNVSLCEDCYVVYNNHKSIFFSSLTNNVKVCINT